MTVGRAVFKFINQEMEANILCLKETKIEERNEQLSSEIWIYR